MCVHVSALLKDEMFLLSLSCTSRTVNGNSGRIDPPPPILNRFPDKSIDWRSSSADGIQQVDLAGADH